MGMGLFGLLPAGGALPRHRSDREGSNAWLASGANQTGPIGKGRAGAYQKKLWVCLTSHFTQKNLGFDPSFCKIELNTMQNFWQKVSILYFEFWP
jgi:hypothetical protein